MQICTVLLRFKLDLLKPDGMGPNIPTRLKLKAEFKQTQRERFLVTVYCNHRRQRLLSSRGGWKCAIKSSLKCIFLLIIFLERYLCFV